MVICSYLDYPQLVVTIKIFINISIVIKILLLLIVIMIKIILTKLPSLQLWSKSSSSSLQLWLKLSSLQCEHLINSSCHQMVLSSSQFPFIRTFPIRANKHHYFTHLLLPRLVVVVGTIFTILILEFSGCCCFVAVLPMFHHEPCFAQNSNWPIRSQRGSSKRELPTLDEDRIDEKSCFANNYQHIGCYYYVEGDVALLQYIDVLHNVTQANENLGEEIFLRRWCHVQLMVKMMLVLVSTWWGAVAKIGQLFWPGFVEIGLDGCFPKGNGRPWFAENLDHFSSIFFPITITNLALSPPSEVGTPCKQRRPRWAASISGAFNPHSGRHQPLINLASTRSLLYYL